jgi:transposase
LTDTEWAAIRPLLPVPGWLRGRGGRPEGYCHRAMLDALRYLVDNGIKWRAMPADFPPWDRVYAFFRRWRDHSLVKELHDRLRGRVREKLRREAEPTAGVIDSQSIKRTPLSAPTAVKRLGRRFQLAHRTPPGRCPVDAINSVTNDPAPSLHPRYRGFITTTSRSAGTPRVGTRPLAVTAAWGTPSRPPLGGQYRDLPSPVPCGSRRPDSRRLHAGHHLANKRAPARLIPEFWSHPGFDAVYFLFDTSAAIHLRSSSRPPPDASYDAFSLIAHHDSH